MVRPLFTTLSVALALAACAPGLPVPGRFAEEELVTRAAAPPGAPPGTCWGKDVTPAIIETVTEQLQVEPPQIGPDGAVLAPGVYRTETRQEIVREREEAWFETPCPEAMTPEFIESLQRALAARGLYRGPVTGEMDRRTRRGVRGFQREMGFDSDVLTLAAARQMGLAAVTRPGQ